MNEKNKRKMCSQDLCGSACFPQMCPSWQPCRRAARVVSLFRTWVCSTQKAGASHFHKSYQLKDLQSKAVLLRCFVVELYWVLET